MESLNCNTLYKAYLCCRIPNNHCNLCSYFLPNWAQHEVPYHSDLFSNGCGMVECPSCNRSCIKVFVSIENEDMIPERVPDSYVTKDSYVVSAKCGENREFSHPVLVRDCYNPEFWENYVNNKYEFNGSSYNVRSHKATINNEQLELDSVIQGLRNENRELPKWR